MIEIKEAYEILRRYNPIVRPLPEGSLLWKKIVLEILNSERIEDNVLKAAIVVGGTIEDVQVAQKMYDFFKKTQDDNIRKLIVESWSGNFLDFVLEAEFEIIGIRERILDRYVRQIASQNIINAFKKLNEANSPKARSIIWKLKKSLNDSNTFTRMNAVIIMRSINNKSLLLDLERRLELEKKLLSEGIQDVGIPYVIRELEKSINFYKERS
ncbi:MAG: hypothetical protein N2202_06880 [Proteobacteria bacterium]|nr:hypothetical protein [Pseudomonadota bacterium]